MKNRYLVLLAGLLVAGSMLLVACGDKNDKPADTNAPTAAQTDPATNPEESSSTPEESSSAADESASTPEESDSAFDESASTPEESSTEPEESSTEPEESSTEPQEPARYEDWLYWYDYVTRVSYDEIRLNGITGANIMNSADPLAIDDTISELFVFGWVAVMNEDYEFGYVIDDGEIISDPSFTLIAEQRVQEEIINSHGVAGNRFGIAVDVAALEGAHNVKALVRVGDRYFIIAEFNMDKAGVTETGDETVTPDNVYTVDISTLADQDGYMANFLDACYVKPLFLLYDNCINLGEMDLSQYSKVRIQYACDGGAGTQALFDALNGDLPIGLKSTEGSYGNSGSYEMDGDIAHGDMVFSSTGWAAGARWVEIDLTNVDYAGNVYVAVHNPVDTQIAISAIQFVLAETQPEA